MTDLSRVPAIIGVAQSSDRDPDIESPRHPRDVLAETVLAAMSDSGGFDAGLVDTVATIPVHDWTIPNQSEALASGVGIGPARYVRVANGGEAGIKAVNWLAQQIVNGTSNIALLAGGNMRRVSELAARQGRVLKWAADDASTSEPEMLGEVRVAHSDLEVEVGLDKPPFVYPLFENALRSFYGRTIEAHMGVVGELFERFTEVAASNPHAWFPVARTAEELITPTPANRLVAYPYTKYLNAILSTNQSSAIIVASAQAAIDMGVPRDRLVFWWGGNSADERAWHVSTRPDFSASPAMLDSHSGALANAGLEIDEIDLIDFYSCFPAVVELAVKMLRLDLDDSRGFTLTGGLPYAGGPGSSYTLHSLATMVDRIRERPEARALVTGNGLYATKHSASVWSGVPFTGDTLSSVREGPQPSDQMDTSPRAVVATSGRGVVETYTVVYGRDGAPIRGVVLGRIAGRGRFLARMPADRQVLEEFVSRERIGTEGAVRESGSIPVFTPE